MPNTNNDNNNNKNLFTDNDNDNDDDDDSVKAAQADIQMILNETRPKHFGHGVWSGVESIVGGGIGAIGIAVLTPVQGAAMGARHGGILGGAAGALGGTVVGVVQAASVAAGGEWFCGSCSSSMMMTTTFDCIALIFCFCFTDSRTHYTQNVILFACTVFSSSFSSRRRAGRFSGCSRSGQHP